MKIDKTRVFTAVNADELPIGSYVIVGDTLYDLENEGFYSSRGIIDTIGTERDMKRFYIKDFPIGYALAYLLDLSSESSSNDTTADDDDDNFFPDDFFEPPFEAPSNGDEEDEEYVSTDDLSGEELLLNEAEEDDESTSTETSSMFRGIFSKGEVILLASALMLVSAVLGMYTCKQIYDSGYSQGRQHGVFRSVSLLDSSPMLQMPFLVSSPMFQMPDVDSDVKDKGNQP